MQPVQVSTGDHHNTVPVLFRVCWQHALSASSRQAGLVSLDVSVATCEAVPAACQACFVSLYQAAGGRLEGKHA